MYSTCTTNIEENERQLEYACDEIGYLFSPLVAPEGVEVEESLIPRFAGCMRIATSQDAQGFFVAALIKPHTATAPNAGAFTQALPLAVDPEEKALLDSMRNPFLPGAPNRAKGRRSGKNTQAQRTFKNTSWLEAERIGGHSLDGAFASSTLLPQGDLALYNDVVHFLPKAAATLLPPTMSWKGFPLGKVGADGAVKVAASLRALMPSLAQAKAQGLPIMEMEDPALLQALLSGQSVTVEKGNSVLGLYYLGLPLCTLTVKGSRAILPNRQ